LSPAENFALLSREASRADDFRPFNYSFHVAGRTCAHGSPTRRPQYWQSSSITAVRAAKKTPTDTFVAFQLFGGQ
jgi:hypothetical protein